MYYYVLVLITQSGNEQFCILQKYPKMQVPLPFISSTQEVKFYTGSALIIHYLLEKGRQETSLDCIWRIVDRYINIFAMGKL